MTNHTARLYALAVAIFVFFVAWAAVAARPWATASAPAASPTDPRVAALVAKQQRVRAEALAVNRVLAARRQQAPGLGCRRPRSSRPFASSRCRR